MEAPTLLKNYKETVVPALKEELGCENIHQVPKIEKVVINCCVGREADRKQAVQDAIDELQLITGQKAVTYSSPSLVWIIFYYLCHRTNCDT